MLLTGGDFIFFFTGGGFNERKFAETVTENLPERSLP